MDVNITEIHLQIIKKFERDREKKKEYSSIQSKILSSLKNPDLLPRSRITLKENLVKTQHLVRKHDTESQHTLYVIESNIILKEFEEIVDEPVLLDFSNSGKTSKTNKRRKKIRKEYLKIASKYDSSGILNQYIKSEPEKLKCPQCGETDFDDSDCTKCGYVMEIFSLSTPDEPIAPTKSSSKSGYDRGIHFNDTILQYQGKQNCNEESLKPIYERLEEEYENHGILIHPRTDINGEPVEVLTRAQRFAKATKKDTFKFLREMGYTQYKNTNYIHTHLTDQPLDNISAYEEQIKEDFQVILAKYDEMYEKRNEYKDVFKDVEKENFLTSSFILYQLLLHHGHPCVLEDFGDISTIQRKNTYDDICEAVFFAVGISYKPFY